MNRTSKLFRPKTAADDVELKHRAALILDNIDIFVKKAIDSFENLASVGNERETIALLTESNAFANDLEGIVHNLTRIVIKTFKSGHSSPDAVKVTKTFSNHVHSLQKTFNVDINELKQELKLGLEGVSVEARKLYDLLETEPTYGTELLTLIDDLLFIVKKVHFRNILEIKTPEEVKNMEVDIRTRYVNLVGLLNDKLDDASITFLLRSTYHAIIHLGAIVRTLDEDAEGYDEKVKSNLRQIAFTISEDLAVMDNVIRSNEDPAAIKHYLLLIGRAVVAEMISLVSLDNPYSPNEKISINLNNLILLIISHHLATAEETIVL